MRMLLAKAPPVIDETGRPVPGAIVRLEPVGIGASKQWIQVRGRDPSAPLLLYLSGGPCGSEMAWIRHFHPALERHFVVVHWDQRGAAKSYRAANWKTISPAQMIDDGGELLAWLLERFGRDKLWLVGNSWGSILGVELARRWPERLHGYVGLTQQVNTRETDRLGWSRTLERARAARATKDVRALEEIGAPPYPPSRYVRSWFMLMGNVRRHGASAASKAIGKEQMRAALTAPEYDLVDRVRFFVGLVRGWKHVYAQLGDLDFERDVPRLEIPIALVLGREDVTVPPEPAARWLDRLLAPRKELRWIEGADHNLSITAAAEVDRILIEFATREG